MEKNLNKAPADAQTSDLPRVTVIIPTYNRADLIGQAIESVQKQTFTDWEIIVIDDASKDNTAAVVAPFVAVDLRIRYFVQLANVGIARNRNTGLDQARGTYIAMLDSDDVWLDPNKLAEQVKFLDARPDYALVGTYVTSIDLQGKPVGTFGYETGNTAIRRAILFRNQFTQSSVLYRLSAAREAGNYDTSIIVNDDYGLWLAIGRRHKFANLSEPMTGYRIHPQGITKTRPLVSAREHLQIIKKYRADYPNYFLASIKARLRILKAYLN